MDARAPVDSKVFLQKRAVRKYLGDSGLTDVKPGGRQYTLTHGQVLVEAIAARIEPLEFCREVERETRLNLVVHDLDALFNIVDQQRRNQAVIEANDTARVTLDWWPLWRLSSRAMLLSTTTQARGPRTLGGTQS